MATPQPKTAIFIDVDPNAPHTEECNFWHGGVCDCTPQMRAALRREHCHECDYVNSYTGSALCNCRGRCICERLEEDCSCIGRSVRNFGRAGGWLMVAPPVCSLRMKDGQP